MTARRLFYRKVQYALVIALMLLVLNWLFRPATRGEGGVGGDPGGKLAQVRQQCHLGHSYLGEVDLTFETVTLAMFGMQCVASNVLWAEAHECQKSKDWVALAALIEQLTKLQRNYVKVWDYQAWNMSFNVAASFDDYRQKYRWTIKGFECYLEGMKYNEREATLQNRLAFSINQKIGRSDERKLFRKMFREDDDFHGSRPLAQRDNWLVARDWYLTSEEMGDHRGAVVHETPVGFRASSPQCLMYYADALEIDGTFGETAQRAWAAAGKAWQQFGMHQFVTPAGKLVRLGELALLQQLRDQTAVEFEALSPGLGEKIRREKRDRLSPPQRQALDTPAAQRTDRQHRLADLATRQLYVSPDEVARRIDPLKRRRAAELVGDLTELNEKLDDIRGDREIVNYDYWKLRAEVEQSAALIEARRAIYQGDRDFANAVLEPARASYEKGFAGWRKILDRYSTLAKGPTTRAELVEVIKRYREVLRQSDLPFPRDFILNDVLKP